MARVWRIGQPSNSGDMLFYRLHLSRLLSFSRPLRPPRSSKPLPGSRLFTQNSQLLRISGVSPRPQLPFLHPATGNRYPSATRNQFQIQLYRLITTETKRYFRDQLWIGVRYSAYTLAAWGLLSMMVFGIQSEVLERRFPPPPEWTMISRFKYCNASSKAHPDPNGTTLADWGSAGQRYLQVLKRLEDPSVDGQDLEPISKEEGDTCVAGLRRAGLDVSHKSEPWRRGYYACLMGAAKASENRAGWVCDTTRKITFPPEVVIGPSNPRPKPVPYGAQPAPLEENCVPASEPAETYYMKILTTQGFNSRQRLDAALAYADWLDFQGLSSTAEEVYDWGLDIATGALPVGVDNVVDIKSGVIDQGATYITSNILLATTSLAFHHARNNNIAAALPIYLSVLRARRQLLLPPSEDEAQSTPPETSTSLPVLSFLRSMLVPPPYPPAPSTGDEIPFRTPAAICEEAGVMAHIGEIMFASSSASSSTTTSSNTPKGSIISPQSAADRLKIQRSGLGWTRDAVDLAEATITSAPKDDEDAREKCSECLTVGMNNWSTMVAELRKDERQPKAQKLPKASSSWLWSSSAAVEDEGLWERESEVVEERLENVRRLLSREADRKASKGRFSMY